MNAGRDSADLCCGGDAAEKEAEIFKVILASICSSAFP